MKNEVNVRYDDSRFPVLEENSPWNWWFLVPSWRTKRCFEIPPYFRTAEGFLFQNRRIRLILETDDMGLMKNVTRTQYWLMAHHSGGIAISSGKSVS